MTQETYKATEKYSAPKELIRQLLEAVSIRRVINVDDDHGRKEGSKESLEDVLGALQAGTIDCSVVMKLIPGEEGYHEMDIEDVIEHVTDAWDMLEMEHKVQLTHIATRESGDSSSVDEERDDETSIVTLPTLLEGVVDFEQMSFSEWRERGMSLLEDGKTTLLLLDRSFEKEGMSEIAGEELANEIVNNDDIE